MNDDNPYVSPTINDDDIRWASNLLNLQPDSFFGSDGDDPRQEVFKSMEQIDVAACPGSGKTTLLVAKLATLAKKWCYQTRGICVLSHTNAAREEIELKLGAIGQSLLSYPHYIGTIHGFVNEFLAIPWLRSCDYPIKIIDTDICLRKRWNSLQIPIRNGLEKNRYGPSVMSYKSADFDLGEIRWGKSVLGANTNTYKQIQDKCKETCSEGYFCYDEMFIWANDIMDRFPGVIDAIRNRFPLLFIDEAQDNSEDQSTILHRIFINGNKPSICQRFGDPNQAIYNSVYDNGTNSYVFPDIANKIELFNSYRFGQIIADLADPLGLNPYCIKGLGPKKSLESGSEAKHTIFLVDNNNIDKAIESYAELLMETFSAYELKHGIFTAIGLVHRGSDDNHKPHYVGDYWPIYDPELSLSEPKPQTFLQYIYAGLGKSEIRNETFFAVEKIAEGILRLAGILNFSFVGYYRKYSYCYVLKLLERNNALREKFENFISSLVIDGVILTKELWNDEWKNIILQVAKTISSVSESTSPYVAPFLEWNDCVDEVAAAPQSKRDNIYRLSRNGKEVAIQLGSIHSVKGETHTATLVLETFWHNHNMESIMKWLCNDKCGSDDRQGKRINSRLKTHYVAMTRPRQLLCLVMKRSSFEDARGKLDESICERFTKCGWHIKSL